MSNFNTILGQDGSNKIFCFLALLFPALCFLIGKLDWIVNSLFFLYLIHLVYSKGLVKLDAVAIIALVFTVVLITEYFWHLNTIPPNIFRNEFSHKYLKFFFFFFLIAYGTTATQAVNPFWILASAAIGLTLFIVFKIPAYDWQISWQGSRPGFGFRNAQHAAVVFSSSLICLIFFHQRLYQNFSNRYKPLIATWLFLFTLALLWIIVTTQVRAVWLGLIVSGITSLLFTTTRINTKIRILWQQKPKNIILPILGILICIIFLFGMHSQDRINKRLSAEHITYQTIEQAGHFKETQLTSSGIRIASWSAAIDWGLQRPMAGWGYKAVPQLIKHDKRLSNPEWQGFGHLHNSYFEAWIAMGFIGLTIMLATILYVARRVRLSFKENRMPKDVYVFSWAFIAFWLTVNCFESYINYPSGFYITSIIGGFIYAYCLPSKR